jgi:hypothetical protein
MAGEELGTCVSHSTHVFLGLGTAVLSRHHVRLPISILELLHTLSPPSPFAKATLSTFNYFVS